MAYYIGVDLGTSAMKLLLVTSEGEILYSTERAYPLHFPQPGWSEQDPNDWWNALVAGIAELTARVDKAKIRGIGVAGQMHGLVALDSADNVIRPAILWNDGRTDKQTRQLNEGLGVQKLDAYTGNMAFAGFTAPKLLWMQENEPECFKRIEKIMLPKDYINYKLTGVYASEPSDAAGTLLFDVNKQTWSKEMLEYCGLAHIKLPKIFKSYEKIGTILPRIAAELNLREDCIVVGGAGDNAAAAVGTNTLQNSRCNISLGTSGTVFIAFKEYPALKNKAIHTFCHVNGQYHLLACILSAASCNKWFCDSILQTEDYAAEQQKIVDEKLGENPVYFLPYLMGERSPINDTDASGTFVGLRASTTRTEMLQAVLEGVAFAIRDNFEIVRQTGIPVVAGTLCGGGAKSMLWRKILANVLNITLHIPTTEQGPGLGGALLAMVGDGVYKTIESAAESFYSEKDVIEPDAVLVQKYEARYQKYRQIYPAIKEVYKKVK